MSNTETIEEKKSDILCEECNNPAIVELAFNDLGEYDKFVCQNCGIKKLQENPIIDNTDFKLTKSEAGTLHELLDSLDPIVILPENLDNIRKRLGGFDY